MQNRPAYAIESVDRALRLAALLQHEGALRLTDAAAVLDIPVSSAHRLLSMLVYRDFAEQLPDRSYGPGPVLRTAEPSGASVTRLRQIGPIHLRSLVDRTGESGNLMVLVGDEARFICTVESDRVLRVGDRAGRSLPAHQASGGKALLARLDPADVVELYADVDAAELRRLQRSLDRVRAEGYGVNRGETEDGVTAIGMAVDGADGAAVCAVSVGMPTSRFSRARLPELVDALADTRRAIEADLV